MIYMHYREKENFLLVEVQHGETVFGSGNG